MPYKRSYRKYKLKTKSPMATKAFVRKAISKQADNCFIDTAFDSASMTNVTGVTHLSAIGEGDGETNRDGLSVHLKSLELRCEAQANLTTPLSAHCRVIVFRWNQSAAPTATSITLASGVVQAPISMFNITGSLGKYQILYDKSFNIVVDQGNDHVMFKKYIRLNSEATFSTAAVNTPVKGSIWLQLWSDLAANGPDIHMRFRVKFTN